MKMSFELWAVFIVLLLCVSTRVVRWIHHRRRVLKIFKQYGIPGPEPSFFGGNMYQLREATTPNQMISKWLKQYGNVFGYFIGENPYLVVNDLDVLKQAMIKDFSHFLNRPDMVLDVKPLIYSILSLRGQRWKDVRSVLTPSFSSSKIKLMTSIMDQKATNMIQVVKQKALDSEMFDIYQVVQGLTLDVIADCAFAMKANCVRNPKDPFLLAVRNFFLHAHNKAVEFAIFVPLVAKILTFVANFLTAGQMTTMIVSNVKDVISQRRKNIHIRGNDMLQLMLDAAENREGLVDGPSGKKKNVLLTDDEIIGNAYVFLLAGYETTATALAFIFYLLVQHPEIQEKLYDEISSNLTDDNWSYDAIQSLQYLDQVFNESLRIYPPVTGFVSRKCNKECTIGDLVVPEGVILQAPVWDIHHDPELWPDPWKFDPDRFSPENKSSINNVAFLPFGAGPRNCIGMRFAQLEAKLAISRLVKTFKFVRCEKTEDRLQLICPTVIINPANGVYLRAVLRDP